MQLLFVLFKSLAAIGFINGQLEDKPSVIAECHNLMDVQQGNLRPFVECLSRSTNLLTLTASAEGILQLLVHKLDKSKTEQSPYVHIDDVLKIEGSSILALDCQGRQHVMYAIRRKLAQLQLLHQVESKVFATPQDVSITAILPPEESIKSISATSANPKEIPELSCLIARAIRRHKAAGEAINKSNE